jgi:hypothetical protein
MGAKVNKIFTGYQLCQSFKNEQSFRDDFFLTSGPDVTLCPNRPIYIPPPSPWALANGQIVDRVMESLGLVFFSDWCISSQILHVGKRMQGPTESQTLVRVKVSWMISLVPSTRRFVQYTGVAASALCSFSILFSATAEFSRWSMLRHEGVWGNGCIDPHFLDLGTSWRWVVNFTPRPLYSRGKEPPVPIG